MGYIFCALLVGLGIGWMLGKRGLHREEQKLREAFEALSSDALAKNNQLFLDLAKTSLEKFQEGAREDLSTRQKSIGDLVKPVQATMEKFEAKMQDLEKARLESASSLSQQMSTLTALQQQLSSETHKISSALKSTTIRGRWGEIQLKRVVEMAGMLSHCDFFEQESRTTEEGRRRPDLLVRLPAGKQIIIDAKAPLDAYLESCEEPCEETRKELLKKHAVGLRHHIRHLASKGYAQHFEDNPEFVVLFLPGEIFFSAALSADPSLIEAGADQGIILATPTTLIALLRAVSYGWKQESISQNAQKISQLGRDLYKRLSIVGEHWGRVGKSLESAVRSYNEAVGSMERRVLPKAREFEKLDASSLHDSIEPLTPIEQMTREMAAPELTHKND